MPSGKASQRGFAYLFVLMLIATIGLGLAAAGSLWQTDAQRARDQSSQGTPSLHERLADDPALL